MEGTWTKIDIEPLGEGGQGTVWLVKKSGQPDPVEEMVLEIRNILHGGNTPETLQLRHQELRKALTSFLEGKYIFGAKKQLLNPTPEMNARLAREAEVYERIADPHLLRLLDKDINNNWIVTEYHPQGSLQDRLENYRGDVLKTLLAIRPLAYVLTKMHEENFVHRDFNPRNIFVGRDGQLVLGDAGLALALSEDETRVTKTTESVGSRHYKPAWTYGGRLENVTPTFDIFSVGKVIWAMIAGRTTCPLWYVVEDKYDLELLFPNRTEMLWINRLLGKCVVEKEREMKLRDGADLLREIDVTLGAVLARAVPPDQVLNVRRCRVCFIGKYIDDKSGHKGGLANNALRCNECGHLDFFDRK